MFEKEAEENTDRQKQDEEFRKSTEEFEKEVEREKARIMRNLYIQLGAIK